MKKLLLLVTILVSVNSFAEDLDPYIDYVTMRASLDTIMKETDLSNPEFKGDLPLIRTAMSEIGKGLTAVPEYKNMTIEDMRLSHRGKDKFAEYRWYEVVLNHSDEAPAYFCVVVSQEKKTISANAPIFYLHYNRALPSGFCQSEGALPVL